MITLRRYIIVAALAVFTLNSCKTKKPASNSVNDDGTVVEMEFPEVSVYPSEFEEEEVVEEVPVYQASRTIKHDLLHIRLELSLDWEKQYIYGKATLSLQPYFYSSSSLSLDAKGMEIKRIGLLRAKDTLTLNFEYTDNNRLNITLDKEYKKEEKYQVYIEYTAKPSELEEQAGEAISDARGFYFINPKGEKKDKPKQAWTQGETESNSCWFPTIDAPNEKMTHEIWMTVADSFTTVSNGKMVSQKKNNDGTRTDYWKMEKPHAVYLVAMVVGQFHIVRDQWKGMPVSYFVDPKYAASAKTIFGNTPEMIEFFSKQLNYPYPWPKYDQAVVFDFVSGAMENTSITIHGSMLQLDTRELLDVSYEDVIAHELYHHWFGDLVTCESWSNIPLNESFATYSVYLWKEYKYGKQAADLHLQEDQGAYFNEATEKQVNLIRYDYEKPLDMFDRHSYQKGAAVLHMLRNYVGDEAFFASLNLYLTEFAYKNAEIHNLRHCFEKVTGEDLNWFFNQWFLGSGHPDLNVVHYFQEDTKEYTLEVQQKDEFETPLFRLPVNVTFHFKDSSYTTRLDLRKRSETFTWTLHEKPVWVSFDSDKMLLAKVEELKNETEWLAQLQNSSLFADKYQAIRHLTSGEDLDIKKEAASIAIADPFFQIKNEGHTLLLELPVDVQQEFSQRIIDDATNHPKAATRASAFYTLARNPVSGLEQTIEHGLNDSSYSVNAAALNLLAKTDTVKALRISADKFSKSTNDQLKFTAFAVLSESDNDYIALFEEEWKKEEGPDFYLLVTLIKYIRTTSNHDVVYKGLQLLNSFEPRGEEDFFMVLFITRANEQITDSYKAKLESVNSLIKSEKDPAKVKVLEAEKLQIEKVLSAAVKF